MTTRPAPCRCAAYPFPHRRGKECRRIAQLTDRLTAEQEYLAADAPLRAAEARAINAANRPL